MAGELNDYNTTQDASQNTSASPDGAPEGMAASGMNNTTRQLMSRIARERDDTQGVTATAGSGAAYTLAAIRTTASAYTGELFLFRASFTCNGAATINITPSGGSARGAVAIQKNGLATVAGSIISGGIYLIVYDGTQWQIIGSDLPAPLGSASLPSYSFQGDPNTGMYSPGADQWAVATAGNQAIAVSAAGEVTFPLTPAFFVISASQANITGDGTTYTVQFTTEVSDQGGDYASNAFTAPVTAGYDLTVNLRLTGLTSSTTAATLTFVLSNRSLYSSINAGVARDSDSNLINMEMNVPFADMDSADTFTITMQVSHGSATVDIASTSYVAGRLAA